MTFGYVKAGDRTVRNNKGHEPVGVTGTLVTITFDGARSTGKSTIMRAIVATLLPEAKIVDPYGSAGQVDTHALTVEVTPEIIERLRKAAS